MNKRLRVAIVCDYPEEGWPSMDLTAQMTLEYLERDHADAFEATRVCPPFRHRLNILPIKRLGRNFDRLLNRFHDYPRALRRLRRSARFDVFHIVDHSYAQLVHELPAGRTVVTCHDLDTFRCLLQPELEPRPAWFRQLTRRTLTGLQAAAALSCDSNATRDAILRHQLIEPERLTTNYLGTDACFSPRPDPKAEAALNDLIGPPRPDVVELLHVGSNIPRKRIDVLLNVFAAVRRQKPGARLIKLGGEFTPAQATQAQDLGISDAIHLTPFLQNRSVVAALYRRVALVLQPSEAEGFGLPLAEAMACGAPLLASDLAVLREVAGEAAIYREIADIPAWSHAALELIADAQTHAPAWHARREAGLARATLFRWDVHAARLAELYRRVAEKPLA